MTRPAINILRVILVGVIAAYSIVGVAIAYDFGTNDDPTRIDCSDYVTHVGSTTSSVSCAVTCVRHTVCRGFVYEPGTLKCSLIYIHNFPEGRCTAWGGYHYFALPVQSCDQYLVSRPGGVANSQLSESSNYCADSLLFGVAMPECQPVEMRYTSVWYARLTSLGYHTGAWTAYYTDQNQYVQVDFLQPKIVSAVVLTARDPEFYVQYVTSFKVLYSDDCSVFKEIVDDNGTPVILEGCTNENDVRTSHLPERIEARCFRINPITWFGAHISLRFDLLGCP